MLTMLDLRGDDNFLLSIDRAGRDTVRRYMYEQIFDDGDGSSRLSRDNPKGLVDVGGELMTQEALHHQIICFLEDKLEEMTRSPSPQADTPHVEFQSAQHHRPDPGFIRLRFIFFACFLSRLAQQQRSTQQAWQGSRLAETSSFNQVHPREKFETRPNPSNGAQIFPYGQHLNHKFCLLSGTRALLKNSLTAKTRTLRCSLWEPTGLVQPREGESLMWLVAVAFQFDTTTDSSR